MLRQTLGLSIGYNPVATREILSQQNFTFVDRKVCRDIEKNVATFFSIIQFEIVSQHSNFVSRHKIAFST